MFRKSLAMYVFTSLVYLILANLSFVRADGHCDFADETIKIGGIAPLSAPGATGAGVILIGRISRRRLISMRNAALILLVSTIGCKFSPAILKAYPSGPKRWPSAGYLMKTYMAWSGDITAL